MTDPTDRKVLNGEILAHTLLFVHHCFTIFYMHNYVDLSVSKHSLVVDMQTFRARYVTTWNFGLQTLYLGMIISGYIIQLFPQNKRLVHARKVISNVRGFMYTSLVFPCGLIVVTMFWTIWFVNRELVLPQLADELFPSWINHCIHTNILLVPLLEVFIYKKTPTFIDAAKGAFVFFFLYNIALFFTYYETSKWLYGMLAILSWPERFFLMLSIYLVSLVLIKLCLLIEGNVHRNKLPDGSSHKLISKKLL